MQKKPTLLTPGNRSLTLEDAYIKLNLGYDGKISADIGLGGGRVLNVDTGLTKSELCAKMRQVAGMPEEVEEAAETRKARPTEIRARNRKLLDDLKALFDTIHDPDAYDADVNLFAANLKPRQGLVLTETDRLNHAKLGWREKRMDPLVTRLTKALTEARGMDRRNVQLVNDVRQVCYGNTAVDSAQLLQDIADALNTKPVNPMKNIADAKLEVQIDDLSANLNINAILNGN